VGRAGRRPHVRRLTALLVAAVFVTTAAAGCDVRRATDTSGQRGRVGEGDTRLRPLPPALGITRTPSSWHIVYRLEEETGANMRVSTDKVWVRRPFDSVLETWSGPPPGNELQVRQLATFTRRTNGEVTLELPPTMPASDVRVLGVLDAALAHGALVRRGVQKEIAGRRCEVYRSFQLLSAPVLRPPDERGEEYGDSCVDEAGLVLEEVLVDGGDQLARRVAVSVEEDVALGDELFPVKARTVEVAQGGGRVRPLVPGNRPPGEFFELDGGSDAAAGSVPFEGFVAQGRWSVVPPQPENFVDVQDDIQAPLRQRAAVTDVFVRGVDVVLIEQGGTRGGAPPYTPDEDAPRIDLGPVFGEGEVVLSAQEVAVRVQLPGGRYVRVAGTLTPPELAAVAKRLVSQPGGTLDFADD